MQNNTLTLLNTSILTSYGEYSYRPVSLQEAKQMIKDCQAKGDGVKSAIGHKSTADLLTELLDFPVPVNRMEFKQTVNDVGLIFKLKQRPPEGIILTREQLEMLGYEFGLLKRTV
jgi:hypothetical protein